MINSPETLAVIYKEEVNHLFGKYANCHSQNFAENLKHERRKLGLTQDEAAIACDLPFTVISQYERGHREPQLSAIIKICKGLDVSASRLLGI